MVRQCVFVELILVITCWHLPIDLFQTVCRADEPYFASECGPYALAAAAQAAGIDVDSEALIKKDYARRLEGSSTADLIRAAKDHGFSAVALRGIGEGLLRRSHDPLVLHLAYDSSGAVPGHWITFLGEDHGQAIVFDSAAKPKVKSIPYGELLMYMTGNGLQVSDRAPSWQHWVMDRALGVLRLWPLVLLVPVAMFSSRFGQLNTPWQVAFLLFFALLWATATNLTSPASIAENPGAVAWIHLRYVNFETVATVSCPQVDAWLEREDVTLVDSRTLRQYEHGKLPGARLVSIDMTPEEFAAASRELEHSNVLVVYCNDDRCPWSKIVAARLIGAGFADVRVLDAGMVGFREYRLGKPDYAPGTELSAKVK